MLCTSRLTPTAVLIALAAAASGCGPEGGAPVPDLRLEATGDTVITPYGDIAAGAWLGGARWVVVAPQDRAVGVADFSRLTLAPFGGPRGARELAQPFHLFRAGDSIYVADWQRRRLTAWSLDGVMGGAIPAVDALRGALPRARDERGDWFFEQRPAPGPDGRGNQDSGMVVRMAPDLRAADTVMRLAPVDLAEVVNDGRSRLEPRLLSGQDRWGITPGGAVWVARVGPNRVDWRGPDGRTAEGPALPDRVLPVTENDREIFLRQFEPGLRATVSQIPFSAIKPPFENALTGPDNLVWLVKSRAIGDTTRNYQIVDRSGRLVRLAHHPGLGRILVLGDGLALVGEPFQNGVRLLLYRIPASADSTRR
jgi:hypothetical protein